MSHILTTNWKISNWATFSNNTNTYDAINCIDDNDDGSNNNNYINNIMHSVLQTV